MGKHSLLFSLLRNVLQGRTDGVSSADAETLVDVLEEAEKQSVAALVFDAINRCEIKLPLKTVVNYVAYSQQVKFGNEQLNAAIVALGRLLDGAGVNYAIVKGQSVAAFYPQPLLRQSGDIDFYCDKDNFEKAKQVLQSQWHVEFEESASEYHLHFVYKEVSFELHYSLTSLYDEQKNAYWENLLAADEGGEVLINGYRIKTLSPTLHTLYIFLHLYHHLLELGIGIRQFLDFAMMLYACNDIDREALRHHLQELGMEKAFRACGCIVVENLGLPAEYFPYQQSDVDRRYANRILQVVFYRGNMGKHNKKGGFHGWKHNVESTFIKVSHYMKFKSLAPSYSRKWIAHELKRKILYKMGYRNT